jgi:adenosylcobinamide-phosphate synthase
LIRTDVMLLALLIDAAIGWPQALFVRLGHPVTWIGALISALDQAFNREGAADIARRLAGVVVAVSVIALTSAAAWIVSSQLPAGWPGILVTAILAWPLLAVRSMHDHVAAVARPLAADELDHARQAVAMIVGRDPSLLDQAGIGRAAMESLAENTSDGIVAPLFWGVVFGLPGIAAYKAINTLDSMIGHRTPRHNAFGWAAARIDDVANLVPARLTGLLFALSSTQPRVAVKIMLTDAGQHRSPNAGWPEASMAGALGVRLSGPRIYAGHRSEEPWVNGAAPDPTPADLHRALALYRRAMVLLAALLAVLTLAYGRL